MKPALFPGCHPDAQSGEGPSCLRGRRARSRDHHGPTLPSLSSLLKDLENAWGGGRTRNIALSCFFMIAFVLSISIPDLIT